MVTHALNKDASLHASYIYKKEDGSNISATISAKAERIAAGHTTPTSRETCSFVYHCPAGEGITSFISPDGKEEKINWKENDTFVVPAWFKISHTASNAQDAYLFSFSDRPMLESLGMYRQE